MKYFTLIFVILHLAPLCLGHDETSFANAFHFDPLPEVVPEEYIPKSFHSHECQHDKMDFNPSVDDTVYTEDHHRILQANTWVPISIYVDYTGIATASASTQSYIKTQFFPTVVNFFANSLKVIRYQSTLSINKGLSCPTYTIPQAMSLSNTDLAIFVTVTTDTTSNWVAWASSCQLSGVNYRPIVGQVNLNLAYFSPTQAEYQMNVVKHEMTHVLAFSISLYPYYINPSTNTVLGINNVFKNVTSRGTATSMIITTRVKALAQSYFGCSTVQGLELENQGASASIGSHWETRLIADEVMVAACPYVAYYSPFTAALLEDSGWYSFNYSNTLPAQWGRNRGCSFLNNMCIVNRASISPEFCSNLNQGGCTYNGRYKGQCYTYTGTPAYSAWSYFGNVLSADTFADNCPDMIPFSNGDCRVTTNNQNLAYYTEYFGTAGRCFTGTFVKNAYAMMSGFPNYACFESHCYQNSDGTYTLKVTIDGGVIPCPTAGGNVQVSTYNSKYQGYITCPPANQYCVYPACPSNCSGNGQCVDGACVCYSTWKGAACNTM